MEHKIRYAVCGLGVGKGHCDAAIASEKADLVAVCDLIPEKMEKIAEKVPNLKMYTDFSDLIADPDIDIISICLPSSLHAEYAVRAMEVTAPVHIGDVLCENIAGTGSNLVAAAALDAE